MTASSRRRGAFTLIELLVVIAIFVVLLGLLLSAVQRVREMANRTSCMNNLKQLGLAYQQYRLDHQVFPPIAITDPNRMTGWAPYILPYLEQEPLHSQYNFAGPFYSLSNQAVISTRLKMFQCPSAPSRGSTLDPYSVSMLDQQNVTLSWQASPSDYQPLLGVDKGLITSDF